MHPNYIVFDFDGTIMESAPGITRSVRHALVTLGFPEPDEETLLKFIGPPLHPAFREFGGLSYEQAEEAVRVYRERYGAIGLFEARVYPGVAPLLRALQSAVMAADARCPGHFLLLVRKRVWDDAARLYLGENQPLLPMQTVAALLAHGHAPSAFAAARVSGRAILRRALLPRRRLLRAGCSAPHAGRAGRIRPSGRARPVPAGRRRAAVKPSAGLFFFGIARRIG